MLVEGEKSATTDVAVAVTKQLAAANTLFGILMIGMTQVSCAIEAVWHVLLLPLRLAWPSLYNYIRIWLLRLGWSPVFVGMKMANLEVVLTGDRPFGLDGTSTQYLPAPMGEPCIIMANHQSYADTFFLTYWLHTLNLADGGMMWCIWKTFLYIPLGWASWMCGHVFLGGGPGDFKRLAAVTRSYRHNGFGPFCLYPEGAVLVPHLHHKSNEYAKKLNVAPLQHLLLPRTGAFAAAIRMMQPGPDAGQQPRIIDVTMGFPDTTPWVREPHNLVDLARLHPGRPITIHMHIRVLDAAEIGTSDDEIFNWLLARYQEKETLLAGFKKTGAFPGEPRAGNPAWTRVLADLALWAALNAGLACGLAAWLAA